MLLCKKEKAPELVKIIEIVGDEKGSIKGGDENVLIYVYIFFSFECDCLDEDYMENLGIAG